MRYFSLPVLLLLSVLVSSAFAQSAWDAERQRQAAHGERQRLKDEEFNRRYNLKPASQSVGERVVRLTPADRDRLVAADRDHKAKSEERARVERARAMSQSVGAQAPVSHSPGQGPAPLRTSPGQK